MNYLVFLRAKRNHAIIFLHKNAQSTTLYKLSAYKIVVLSL